LVCSVDSTRWPVSEACTAICAVSSVADFADHHDVRILAQDGAQAAGEGHLDLGVDLGLADAVDVVLDRVLDRHDVARVVVDALERRVQRGGLARAGGAGDQHYAVRLVDQLVDHRLHARLHAERGQFEPAGLLVQQAQHDTLAVPGGHRRDAHVDRAAGDAQADAAVLRQALLGDVEARHDLDARDQQRRHRTLGLQHLAQHAVDAEAHDEPVLEGLDVDVRGVFLDGLGQHGVDQADDRRVVLALQQVGGLGQALRQAREVGLALDALDDLAGLAAAALVGLAQQRVEGRHRRPLDDQRQAREATQFGHRSGRGAFAIDHVGLAVDDRAHEHAMALGEGEGQPRGCGQAGGLQDGAHALLAAARVAGRRLAASRTGMSGMSGTR
jgi:hypothetical protein